MLISTSERSRRVRLWLALGLALIGAPACQRSAAGGTPAVSSVAAHTEPPEPSGAALASRLCGNRAGCAVRSVQELPSKGELIELAIPRAANPEECDGAEYWLVRAGTEARLATDCDGQDGADTRAHARVRIDGPHVIVDYEEGLSSDLCAGATARVSQANFQILEERRWGGRGRLGTCARDAERSTDWESGKHVAHWSSRACPGRPASHAHMGDAIPSYQLTGVTEQTALGSCGANLGSALSPPDSSAKGARLRAAVVDSALLVELSGASSGELSVHVASHSPDDGFMGSVGCGSADEYRVSSATIDLKTGRVTSRGKQAPQLKISRRDESSVQLYAPGLEAVGRLALSFRGSQGERIDSAPLGDRPTAAELPPLGVWFESKNPCQVRSGRLETRSPPASDPLLRLSGS